MFSEIVVVHLDGEDDDAAREGDEVGERQVIVRADKSLYHEGEGADGHHDETWQRDAIGGACADGLNGLGQITQYQTKTAYPAADVK